MRRGRGPTRREDGFVLVNALLIVAALAAAAVFLLARAESGRVRLDLAREMDQAGLYLDGVEALALALLDRDLRGDAVDHLGEAWALDLPAVPVDRGRVSGRIVDLQGRFNINMLGEGASPETRAGFARLAADIGLPLARAAAIGAYLEGGADLRAAYAARPVPRRPPGDPVVLLQELRQVAGLEEAEFQRLQQVAAALPFGAPVNVNTAPPEVLAALLPEGARATLRDLVSERRRTPFATPEAFFTFVALETETDPAVLDPLRFGVESNWFLVESAVQLGQTALRRQTVIQRAGPRRQARVVHRLRMRE